MLTDRGHSLASACKAFGVEQGKLAVERHGVVTPEYIDYNRRDVEATAALASKLLEEYDRFDVELQETQAFSPASLGKAHLRKMGIAPVLERQAIEKRYLGYAQSAFFGGRTSAHIRKVPVPVVYTDFLSMYPTVNALMGLWQYLVAGEVSVVPGDVSETVDFLRTITPRNALRSADVDETSCVRPRDTGRRHSPDPSDVQRGKQRLPGRAQSPLCR